MPGAVAERPITLENKPLTILKSSVLDYFAKEKTGDELDEKSTNDRVEDVLELFTINGGELTPDNEDTLREYAKRFLQQQGSIDLLTEAVDEYSLRGGTLSGNVDPVLEIFKEIGGKVTRENEDTIKEFAETFLRQRL